MKFLITSLIILFLQVNLQAKDIVLAAFFGQGHTNENLNGWLGDEYDSMLAHIKKEHYKKFYLTHQELGDDVYNNVIKSTNCNKANEKSLVIIGSSWGARNAHMLSQKYKKTCGKKVSAFYYLDAIAKPSPWGFGKRPEADHCLALYQTHSWIRGKKAKGCVNKKINTKCERYLLNPKEANYCHIIAAINTLETDVVDDINQRF